MNHRTCTIDGRECFITDSVQPQYILIQTLGDHERGIFDRTAELIEVTYSHGGPASLASVQSCMEKQDFKYMGYFVQEVFVYRLYLSADEQTEFVAYSTNDVIYAEGFGEWAATFQPFNPDHLDLLEL